MNAQLLSSRLKAIITRTTQQAFQATRNRKVALVFCGLLMASLLGCTPSENTAAELPKTTITPKQTVKANPAAKLPTDSLTNFSWQDEVCTNTGYYKRGTYTNAQLRDTYELVNISIASIMPSTTVFYLKDYHDATFTKAGHELQHVYDSVSFRLKNLRVVPTPFWQKMRRLRVLELNENFRLHQAALKAYFQPSTLLQDPTYQHCKEYADALSTIDTLTMMNTWRKLVTAQKQNNGDPDRLEQEFMYQSTSPDRIKYAKIALITFGWYNCANAQHKYNNLSDQYQPRLQFEKLFERVTTADCVDTD